MDRADRVGTGVAVIGHLALFGALSVGLAASIPPEPVPPPAMEVAFVDEVAPAPAAPASEPMAETQAPETGTPIEALPEPAPVPEPLPPAPAPEPQPAPAPSKPKPPEPKPSEPKPLLRAAPTPEKTTTAKPDPKAAAQVKEQQLKAAQAKAAREKMAREQAAKAAAGRQKAAASAAAEKAGRAGTRKRGLDRDILAGVDSASERKADKPAAPAISANAMAAIQAAIKKQIQPCANRQVNPGPGANRILVKLNLKLNKDGSLASAPRVVSTSGVDDENSRFAKRVADLAIAAYTGCAPMKGLPVDLYRTAKGGWNNVNMNYKLPG